jgi:hypothetical protein
MCGALVSHPLMQHPRVLFCLPDTSFLACLLPQHLLSAKQDLLGWLNNWLVASLLARGPNLISTIGLHDADPRGTFAVEDLTLSSKAVIAQVIVNTRYMDLRIRRVRIRQDAFFRLGDACPGASMRGAKNAFFCAIFM